MIGTKFKLFNEVRKEFAEGPEKNVASGDSVVVCVVRNICNDCRASGARYTIKKQPQGFHKRPSLNVDCRIGKFMAVAPRKT